MMCKLTLRAMLLSSVCLLPLKAMGADLGAPPAPEPVPQMVSYNEINLGVGGLVGHNTNLYGRYNGFTEEGVDGLFAFRSITEGTWDSGNTNYFMFFGSDLNVQTGNHLGTAQNPAGPGLPGSSFSDGAYQKSTLNDLGPDASLGFSIGDQGHWDISGNYNAISYTGNVINSIYTMNGAVGTLNAPLVPFGGATLHAAGPITALTPAGALAGEQPFQVGTRRDIFGLTGSYNWNDWKITGAVREEHKEGTMEQSFDGVAGGTAFTQPVNYDTQRYDVRADYATPQVQAQLGYFLSNFTDHNQAAFLPRPTSGTAAPFQVASLYALPPSNYAQYWTGMVGYNVMPGTRVTANARYGLETQNSSVPSNVGDPALVAGGPPGGFAGLNNFNGVWAGTSSPSPDIVAQVFQGNVGVTSAPVKNWNFLANYSVDGRWVSLDQVGGVYGSGSGDTVGATPYAYIVPQEWFKQKIKGEADYKILPQSNTKLYLTYQFDDVDRSNAQVGTSWTNTASLGVSSNLGPTFQGRTFYTFIDRSGVVDYWTAWANLSNGNGNFISTTPSVAYYQAPMTANAANLRFDYAPGGAFSAGIQIKGEEDDFHYPSTTDNAPAGTAPGNLQNQIYGIKHDYNLTAGIDGNYRMAADLNFHAYYTYEQIFYDNLGNGDCADSTGTAQPPAGICPTSAGYFQNTYTSGVHSAGLSAEWKATDKLKIGAFYTFAYGSVMFGEFNGVFVTTTPNNSFQNVSNYPDEHTLMNTVSLKASYALTDNIELGAGVQYAQFYDSDWQFQSCSVMPTNGNCAAPGASTISILTPGYGNPNYSVVMAMAAVKVRW